MKFNSLDEGIAAFKKALDNSKNPLFFFDGDADGLSAFTLLYKYKGFGKGVLISGRPEITIDYARKVSEYNPDVLFILDLALVTQEFIDAVDIPVYWLDHHVPNHDLFFKENFFYFNPRLFDENDGRPTAFWAYNIVNQNLWVAMIGIIGDFHFLLVDDFRKEFPDLLPESIVDQRDALMNSKIGFLVKVINFNLKGLVRDAMVSVKVFTRIDDPYEIINGSTAKSRFLLRRFEKVNKVFEPLLKKAVDAVGKNDDFVVFIYQNNKFSISSELSNELKNLFPDKIIIVGRKYQVSISLSIRSDSNNVLIPLKKTLDLVGGNGGGHSLACGALISEDKLSDFLDLFKKNYYDSLK